MSDEVLKTLGAVLMLGVVTFELVKRKVENSANKDEREFDELGKFRSELMKMVKDQSQELDHLRNELDDWRQRYFALEAKFNALAHENLLLQSRMKICEERLQAGDGP